MIGYNTIMRPERDPKRISEILEVLRIAWEKQPQQRLLQLLINVTEVGSNSLFYIEDDVLLAQLLKSIEIKS